MKPLGDKILVELIVAKETSSGLIIIPDSAVEKPQTGIVRTLGTGRKDKNGNKIPFDVAIGDYVLVSKYGGTEIKYQEKQCKLFASSDIIAVIEP